MNVHAMDLVAVADAIRAGEVTAVAALQSCLDAIERHDGATNAVIAVERDEALQAAEAADRAVAAGAPLGKLHGVPLAHKDMYYRAGKVSGCGSMIRSDWVPERSATVMDRLHDAGSITFARLNMAEFAQNPTGHNRHHGDCHNPWGLDYITGGSSSGSGAAVAACYSFAALGSDTGGSIRLPASACGVTGIKPTQTRVSRAGVMPLSFSADNVGPLARSARDCARLMTVIAGHDPADPTSSAEPVPDYETALTGELAGTRVGLVTNAELAGSDPAIASAMAEASRALQARGATVTSIELPFMQAVFAYGSIVSRCEAATIHARWMRERPQDYAIHLSARLYGGFAIPATYYIEALSARGKLLRAFAGEVFAEVDLIALPTIPTLLPTLADTDIDRGPAGTERRFMAVSINTRPFNYLGLPALSIPCGFDPAGLPIGLQLVGRPFAEGRLLQAGEAFQRETDWHRRRPPAIVVP